MKENYVFFMKFGKSNHNLLTYIYYTKKNKMTFWPNMG